MVDNMKTFENSINTPQLDIDYRHIAFLQFHWHVVLLNSLFGSQIGNGISLFSLIFCSECLLLVKSEL